MSLGINTFEFEEFRLDANEKTLLRDGKEVSLTPKAFQLLLVLIENHGRLVTREELMKAIWAESFVEEGNLTFTINLLRKALKDSSHNPRFIKTVPLSGYKFIAEVKTISAEEQISPEKSKRPISNANIVKKTHGKSNLLIAAVAIFLLFSTIAIGGWYMQSINSTSNLPIFSSSFESKKLSTDGKVHHTVISPDGKNVVYTNGSFGKQSVWMRELQSGNNIEVISQSDAFYGGLAFSPEGNFFYFTRAQKDSTRQLDVFRISIFGGVPVKLVSEAQGWIGVSPDNSKLSFVRCYYQPKKIVRYGLLTVRMEKMNGNLYLVQNLLESATINFHLMENQSLLPSDNQKISRMNSV